MEQKNQNNLEFLGALKSSNQANFKTILEQIKTSGNIEYVPHLLEKLSSSHENEIKKQIVELLHSVKDKKATQYYIAAIERGENKENLKDLLQFCWESGFDLSAYGEVFVKVLIKEKDYSTALEAFTVLEENIMDFNNEDKLAHAKYLKENLSSVDELKKALIAELIRLLES